MDYTLKLLPDIGPQWGLFSSEPRFPGTDVKSGGLTPQNFGLSAELSQALRDWNDQFIEHFTVVFDPVRYGWTGSINVEEWVAEGDRIADLLEQELPEYTIERKFHRYLKSPHLD